MKIYKFELPNKSGPVNLMMPGTNGRPVHFWSQYGCLYLWAEVYPDLPSVFNCYFLALTGDEVPQGVHVGTTQVESLVWHLYKLRDGG